MVKVSGKGLLKTTAKKRSNLRSVCGGGMGGGRVSVLVHKEESLQDLVGT